MINIITAPEIEMLIILNENLYSEFKNPARNQVDFVKKI